MAIEMTVCCRRDLRPIGTIREIYTAKSGRLRAKIEPPKKTRRASFVYFDCEGLVEAKFHYCDYPDPMGSWKKTERTIMVGGSCCDVWVRKQPPVLANWKIEELRSLSVFRLKKIAREMGIFTVPGKSGKRSLMRAILAEQAIVGNPQSPIPNSQSPIPNPQPPAIEPPNPARYYWLNAAHKSQAAALEKLGWEFTANSEIDDDLTFLQKYRDWEFYSVAGEPLLVANFKGASFAIDCSAIAGAWEKEIEKAKRAIRAADKPAATAKQLSLFEVA